MKTKLVTRRRAIAAGAVSLGGLILSRYPRPLPPTCGSLLRAGDNFTYAAHRALFPRGSLAREYSVADITAFPAVGTTNPGTSVNNELGDRYRELQHKAFAEWRLPIEGRVARPQSFSLADLKRFAPRTQITRHTCEEGWAAVAQWTGVPLAAVLDAAGILPSARFVVFHTFDGLVDCLDLFDALHPQTILAYGMNGRELPIAHGAPVRLRVERQIGYKSHKYLQRIVVADQFDDGGAQGDIQSGWAWYTGI